MGKLQEEIKEIINVVSSDKEVENIELLIKYYAIRFCNWNFNRDKKADISMDLWGDFKKENNL